MTVSRAAKWGNSVAVRLPKGLAEQLHIEDGTSVTIERDGDRIVIARAAPKASLRMLLRRCRPEKQHATIDWGSKRGSEVW